MQDNLPKISIRSFREEDRTAIQLLARETALAGRPAELFIGPRGAEMFVSALTEYYFEYESRSIFVAVTKNQVVGYLLGCVDTRKQNRIFKKVFLPRLLKVIVKTAVFTEIASLLRAIKALRSFLRGEFRQPKNLLKEYPAHLHINLDEKVRGFGVGGMLISEYFKFLKQNNVGGVHLESMADGALSFFQSQGFKIVSEVPLSLFSDLENAPTRFRVMTCELK